MVALLVCATLGGALASAAPALQADLHLDTPTQLLQRDLPLDAPAGLESGLGEMKAGGTNVAVMVLWPGRQTDPVERTASLLDRLESEDRRLDAVELVGDPSAARRAASQGRVAIVVALEGAHGLGVGAWEPVYDALVARGLRMLGLTWSVSNRFAGSSGDGGGGLTEEGRALVARARRDGVLLDVSHASRQATLAVCRDSPVPVVASHSNAHAVTAQPRNLTDEEIRCIAGTGGVIGLNFHAPFVGGGADVARVADHAQHLAEIGGRGVVALGSDFDGFIQTPKGLADASALPALWAELERRGWSPAQVAGARGENFMRAWQGAWQARTRGATPASAPR